LRQRLAQKSDAVAQRVEFNLRPLGRRFGCPLARNSTARRVEIELRPFGALERPFVLGTLHELVDVAHLQQHARLPVEAVVLAVQEMVEEAQLQLAPIVGIEVGPVLDAVHFEPFVLRARAHEAFEIAARMQGLAAPIGGREQRRLDFGPDRRARAVVVVVERMGADIVAERAALPLELFFRQGERAADQLAVRA
jgi:hypothetical protein